MKMLTTPRPRPRPRPPPADESAYERSLEVYEKYADRWEEQLQGGAGASALQGQGQGQAQGQWM